MHKTNPVGRSVPAGAPRRSLAPAARLAIALLAAASPALPAADFAASAQYAWSENAGWLNFKDANGNAQVYSDHLEGYAWAENLGWVRLGTYTGGGTHAYLNTLATNYGVNRDSATGALSGYAWSENAGWLNFASANGGGVNLSLITNDITGWAWSENAGWIRFAPYAQPCGPGIALTTSPTPLWQMLALPCVPAAPSTIASVFGDGSPANLNTDRYGTDWVIYNRIVDATPSWYRLLPSSDTLTTGTGYWVYSKLAPTGGQLQIATTAARLTPVPVSAQDGCASVSGCVAVTVTTVAGDNRYNLVGNPFPYPVDWAKVRVLVSKGQGGGGGSDVYTPSAAKAAGYVDNQIQIWNGNSYDVYDDVTLGKIGNLRYFTAFWVNVLPAAADRTVKLLIPAQATDHSQVVPAHDARVAAVGRSWYLAWLDWLIPTAAAAPDPQRTAASANPTVQPPLPSPPPQGGRGQANQRHALSGLAIDGRRVKRVRANLPPGADPEARPAVGWARPDAARTAAAAGDPAAAGTDDPEIALLAAEGADTYGLDPTAALRLIPTAAAAPDPQRTAASANSTVQPPLPSPPPQGGRGQENQRHALGGLAIDGGREERLRANLPPGADPEARPAVGWARPDAARTATAAAETGTDDPEIALLAAEGAYTHGLDPTAALRYAHDQALAEGREWYLRLKVDEPATGYKDHNNVLGQLLTAKDGYDPADLGELPPYAKPYLLLVFPRPAWGEDAGDYSSDYRTAPPIGLSSWPRLGLPPADWRFEVRADRPNTPVVVNWEGPAAIVERSRLIDLATGQSLNPRAYPQGYPVTLTAGTRAFVWRYLGQPTLMTPRREIPGPIPKDIR